jgi:hypothetical protein
MKIRAELFHANGQEDGQTDRQTDRYDEDKSRLLLFYECAENCVSWSLRH